MGIQGLLPLLKSIHKPTHLRNFAGQTIGVDAYGWLHRGTVSCAIELAQQKPTRKHIDFALSRVRMLIDFGIKPYMVFDGAYLPSKEHTERDRASRRDESKKLGLELLSMGRVSQAYLELQKAIDVTPTMARELIEELKRLDVPYIVAPYEADSQLAFLEKQGIISGVLSEDSDLLVFGVKCLLTKLDQYAECVMVNRADFTACTEISLVGWTDKEFRMMSMLSGCDYLPGINKMGLKTAYRLVRKHKTVEKVVRSVQFDGKMKVPPGYLEAFHKAERTFLYQRVFCPEARALVNLNTLPAAFISESMPYIGEKFEPEVAIAIAAGELDPNTKRRITISNSSHQTHTSRPRPVQTIDEKPGKPISEFFKPIRTPLAELDPNSFTPSPSQQRLLQNQHGLSWSASQAHISRPTALVRAATTNESRSVPEVSTRVHSEQWSGSGSKSPKRQRLCSDSTLNGSLNNDIKADRTTSRFFSKQDVEPSPSLRRPVTSKKNKDDFELWSDDSAVEAMMAMTASEEPPVERRPTSPKRRKKIEVYANPSQGLGREPLTDTAHGAVMSQETVATSVNDNSQSTLPEETPLTSFEDTSIDQTISTKGTDTKLAALKAKFTFQAAPPRTNTPRAKSTPLVPRGSFEDGRQYQGLKARAKRTPTSRKPPVASLLFADTSNEKANEEYATVLQSSPDERLTNRVPMIAPSEDEIDDDEWLESERREASAIAGLIVRGSEDTLVPNSPESAEEGSTPATKLDLGQYAFPGHY